MAQQSIKKNTVFNAIKTVSSILFPLITFPYISRVLLPENVGKINFGLSIVSYFSLIASLGITTYAIRECSAVREDKDKLSNTASQIFSINVITTVIAYIALALTLIFYRKLDNYRLLIVIQSLSIVASTMGADWLNSAMEDFKYITIRTVAFQFISLVLMFIFVHQPEDYMKYAVISLVSSAGASITNIWYRRKYCTVRFIRDIKNGIEWKRHMMPIIYLFVMILAQTIFNSVDSTMLGLMHGDREVGIYSTAHKMENIITQVIVSIALVTMPRMAYYFSNKEYVSINQLYRKVFGFFCLLGLPCIVGTSLLANEIISIAAGPEYKEASTVLIVLMAGYIPCLFGGSLIGNIILLPAKREKPFMLACCISAIINIITNLLLIPRYGSVGAAATTFFSNLIVLLILVLYKDKRIKLYNVGTLIVPPIVGCVGIMCVCIGFQRISSLWIRTLVSIVISIFLYTTIQYIAKNELFMEVLNSCISRMKKAKG